MHTIAFLFPGQGSQSVGMGRELAAMYPVAEQTFEEADSALGYTISKLCFEGPEQKLKLTEITQPAILTVSVAVFRVLREKGIAPAYVAGHSVGEYAAHVAAGTLEFSDAVRVARNRGRYMQEAVPLGQGAMAAILGMAPGDVRSVCLDAAQEEIVEPANNNSPEQVVISGHAAAVQRAAELAKERGAKKAVMLQVSAPFHCSLLKPAQDRLEQDLNAIEFYDPEVPVIANIDGEPRTNAAEARDALIRQATGAVQWERSMARLISLGIDVFVEAGPGKVLCGLMRQIDRSKLCLSVQDEASLQKTMNELEPRHTEPG
ncbi:MAG: ACP S-malonyltransferase [Acidobacteria bacterium]|nr:ACP S-malonyltransferase [Acidobacteriota bacterium]